MLRLYYSLLLNLFYRFLNAKKVKRAVIPGFLGAKKEIKNTTSYKLNDRQQI